MAKEILLNKSFIGSWGVANDENIPHEIINLFRSDNGRIYIYVPPYGGFKTSEHREVEYILLTGSWNNNTTEVFYVVRGLTLLHHGGKQATKADRRKLVDYIKRNDIKYGGKYLHEIKMAETEEEKVFYMTFEVKEILKPKKKMFLTWAKDASAVQANDKHVFVMSDTEYKYQRQIGYISGADYTTLASIASNDDYWDLETEVIQSVPSTVTAPHKTTNFLKLIHKEYEETIFTNLFYEFFTSVPGLYSAFAEEVLGIAETAPYTIKTEVGTQDGKGRIDLLAESEDCVIVMENKINSGLNGIDKHNRLSQLTTYINFVESELLNGRKAAYFLFEPNYNDIDIERFDQQRGKEYTKVQYSRIYDFFVAHREDLKASVYAQYADDFIEALYTHSLVMKDVVMRRFTEAIWK